MKYPQFKKPGGYAAAILLVYPIYPSRAGFFTSREATQRAYTKHKEAEAQDDDNSFL